MNFKQVFVPIFAVLLLAQVFTISQSAYGDGLFEENLPPASFGDRQAALFIKINPPILTADTVGDTYLQLKLFDSNTGKTVQHTTYFVEAWKDEKLLLRSNFHAHSGDLTLKIIPTNVDVNDVIVYGDQLEELPNTWTAFGDKIDVHAPVLLDSGLYHFKITITGIDFDRNIFAESQYRSFDSWLSVGDISNEKITYGGKTYDASIISYYDKIENFKFDEAKKAISFSMPFNWDTKRIEGQQIFVHQEVRIPKTFKEFTDTTAYDGKVSGVPTIGRMLILDPYSIEGTSILHFLVNKQEILSMAKTVPAGAKTMDFVVSPATPISKNTFDIKFDSGATAKISFDSNLGVADTIPLHISFFDKNGQVLKYIRYAYSIEDSTGKVLATNLGDDPQKVGIFSTEGIDVQEFKFPKEGSYKMSIGIFTHGLDEQTTYHTKTPGSATITLGKGGQSTPSTPEYSIPAWIKNNAKFWADGKITDKDFVGGIQYLIKQNIIKIPSTQKEGTGTTTIPSWIKNVAKFWAEGQTTDKDFVNGLQYLIKNGIIKI
ncbi:MAG: peptidase [Thaumarchaeota archaeon]|nr:peptidase [Nitrososphaerota archaeon]